MLFLYILWDDWPIIMISSSNEQLGQELEYILLKPDCQSWWISKMQSDTLEERNAIKLCFKLEKIQQQRMECFRLLFDHLAWMELQFLSDIRDSRMAGNLWGRVRGVRRVRMSMHQSWLAKRVVLVLGLLCWGFKGVQEEIPLEEVSTLQIGSVAFSPGQCTSLQLHPCHRLFDQDRHQDSSSPSLYFRPLLPVTFGYSLSTGSVVMRQLSRWKRLWRRSLTRSLKRTSMWPFQKLLEQ